MKHKLSACILVPTLAGYSTAKVGVKMHALILFFISAACFSAFIAVPKIPIFPTLVCVLFLASMQSYSYACTIENMLFLFAQACRMIAWL